MADLVASPSLLNQPATQTAAQLAKRGQIEKTAKEFETQFLSVMFGQLFNEVGVSETFGGGQGEKMFKSFFTDAVAKQVSKAGGIGVSDQVAKEMLKLQGLS